MASSGKKVRIGIIGAGGFANTHMEQFSKLPNVEVVAFQRRNADALKEMQDKWDVPNGFTDHQELLSMPDLDAVDIITPTNTHKALALDAIQAGKHVLCDKPLAMTANDCREMLEAAENAGVIHSTNFNQRGNTAIGRMKRYMNDGFVGDTHHANIWWGMSFAEDARPDALSWRLRPEAGGGSIYELIHVFDMARFIGGEVSKISAKLDTHQKRRAFPDAPDGIDVKVPDSSAFFVEWREGGYAVIHTSFASRGTDPDGKTHARIEISGSNGRIVSDGRMALQGNTGPNGPLVQLEPGAPYPQPYERFVNAVAAGDKSLIETSFYDGYKAAQIVDAAYKSWETKGWADIPAD